MEAAVGIGWFAWSSGGSVAARTQPAWQRAQSGRLSALEASSNDKIEAQRAWYIVAEVPPFLFVRCEAFSLHQKCQEPSIRGDLAGGIGGMRSRRERIEGRPHVELPAITADERQIDCEPKIMPAAAGDVAIAEETLLPRTLRPFDHGQRRAHRPISVEHSQCDALVACALLDTGQRGGRFAPQEGPVGLVARERRTSEIVWRGVLRLHHDRWVDETNVDEVHAGRRIRRDI